ncbi:MAG: LamG-like jellyroll fold domain-containing protein [Candidatus Eisenbacteria bacterium]
MDHAHMVARAVIRMGASVGPLLVGLLVLPHLASAASDTALKLSNVDGGNTAYVRVPNSAAFSLQTFTLEAWVKRVGAGYGFSTDPSGAAIISKPVENTSGSNISSWHLHWTNNGAIHFNLVHTYSSSGVYLLSTAVPDPLARHHLAVTFDGATIRLYIDAVLKGSAAWTLGSVYYGANDVLLGADNFSFGYLRRFDGYIDDVRVWDYARTADQIAQKMNCHLVGNETGLVGYWPFDGSNLSDVTGHGHNGTINGVAASATYAALASLGDCLVGVDDEPAAPGSVATISVHPLPARERFTVSFTLPHASTATIDVVDIAGRTVARLASREFAAGLHEITSNLTAAGVGRPGAGVLFVQLRWEGGTSARRVVLLE